jgi:uncharacterized membrane protein YidH (DUF202 family)
MRFDLGLQPQRTSLAWSRTAISVLINALVVLRTASTSNHTALYALGLGLLIASIFVAIAGAKRGIALKGDFNSAGSPHFLIGSLTSITVATAVAGLICIVLTF